MRLLSFGWTGATLLSVELAKPIERISAFIFHSAHGPHSLTLWRADGSGLRVFSLMHDVAERTEVGVLSFEPVAEPYPEEVFECLPAVFRGLVAVSKLTIDESGTRAESGIILASESGEELVILAGAFPCNLAIRGLSLFLPHGDGVPFGNVLSRAH